MTKKANGFTLTEILVVVTILVIVALAILVGLNPLAQIFKGYDARRKADLDKIKIALENYYSDHECYPNFPKDGDGNATYTCDSNFLSPYLASMPCDPTTKQPYRIYLNPTDATCPQQFAVYAQIYSFFDPNADRYQNCANTYAVYSTDMTYGDINYGCSGIKICEKHYGCKDLSCQLLSGSEDPGCATNYCFSDCGGVDCTIPNNACVPY